MSRCAKMLAADPAAYKASGMSLLRSGLFQTCGTFFIAIRLTTTVCAADQPISHSWTGRDLDAVVDAAVTAATPTGPANWDAVSKLQQLARKLRNIGDDPRAKSVLERAAGLRDIQPNSKGEIIEQLIVLGDLGIAEDVANAAAPISVRAALLGKLGRGLASAGKIEEAKRTAARIAALLSAASADHEANGAADKAIVEIGVALLAAKAPNEALELIPMASNEIGKVQLLAAAAGTLCRSERGAAANIQRGRELLQQALDATLPALKQIEVTYDVIGLIEKISLVADVAEAVTHCKGPADAKAFVSETLAGEPGRGALDHLRHSLLRKGELELAKPFFPGLDSSDSHALFSTADYLMRSGFTSEARLFALQAARITSAEDIRRVLGWRGSLGKLLIDLGEYDEAIAIIEPIDPRNKLQYLTLALEAEIKAKDAASVDRTLPPALSVFRTAAESGVRVIEDLVRITRAFARARYAEEARQCFDLVQAITLPQPMRFNNIARWQMAVLKADLGDVQAGLADAQASGPLTTGPDAAQVMALMAMNMASVQNPTEKQIAEGLQSAKAALTRMAGPKARALAEIATDMAARGDIETAWQAEKGLEGEESNELAGLRDVALRAIAEAQTRTGDLRSAFVTITRMKDSKSQWYSLLDLIRPPTEP